MSLACSAVCAWSTVRLRTEVEGLRSLVNGLSLNSTVYYPQADTNDDFAESSESVAIDPNDPEKLLVTFSAMPREISDGETAKFLIHSNGQSWECEPATTNPYSGSLTIPLVDDYSVYLALTGADGGTRNLFVASESSLKDVSAFLLLRHGRTGGAPGTMSAISRPWSTAAETMCSRSAAAWCSKRTAGRSRSRRST